MNFPNFNPSMFNNIDHSQMKFASDMMAGMSDEQLRSYASMMGMPQMDPQMMRNNINMMKGMDPSQFENIKNTAKNFPTPGASANPSASSSNPSYQRQASAPATDSKQLTKYSQIESLKAKGNDFFKKEQYDQAGSAYFEAIIEIEELRSKNKKLQDDELDTLEISCRLNYANVKAKEDDYDVVLSQAKKCLAIKENGKAYFRLGQAQFHLKKYEEALQNLDKAIPLLPGDTTVTTLRDKAQKVLQAKEGGSSSKAEKEEPKSKTQENESKPGEEHSEEPKEKEKPKSNLKKKNAPKVEDLPLPTINKPKEDRYTAPPESTIKEKPRAEEVKIEEEKAQPPPPRQESSSGSSGFGYGASGMSEEKFKQQQQQLGNMSPDQMKMMTDYFKGMDNASLKSMLKAQMGMEISDSQLESMKMMMTPEMLQNVSKMDMSQIPKNAFQGGAGSTSTSTSRPVAQSAGACTHDHDHSEHGHHHHHAQPQPQGMPTMPPGMDFKLEQAQGMIDMMIQNPEMLKNMIGMIGEGNPIAKFVQNRSPQELAKYLKGLRACLKVYAKVSPLINFLKRYWQVVAGMMIAWAIIRIFNLA